MSESVLIPGISHALQFIRRLQVVGVTKVGSFTQATLQHDDWCLALQSHCILDCRCCPYIVIDGDSYEFDSSTGEVFVRKSVTQ